LVDDLRTYRHPDPQTVLLLSWIPCGSDLAERIADWQSRTGDFAELTA
jgi:hypothetical protein